MMIFQKITSYYKGTFAVNLYFLKFTHIILVKNSFMLFFRSFLFKKEFPVRTVLAGFSIFYHFEKLFFFRK
jgi:hypothetical protein